MDQTTPTPEEGAQNPEMGTHTTTDANGSTAVLREEQTAGHNPALMGILAYIGPLVLIPYFLSREDLFVKFHIRQGLVLLVISAIVWVLEEFMMWSIFAPLLAIVNIIILVLSIIGIINVLQKKENPLPIVGGYADHFKV